MHYLTDLGMTLSPALPPVARTITCANQEKGGCADNE